MLKIVWIPLLLKKMFPMLQKQRARVDVLIDILTLFFIISQAADSDPPFLFTPHSNEVWCSIAN